MTHAATDISITIPSLIVTTVLCGELSLGAAIVAEEWVKAHDLFGRNR